MKRLIGCSAALCLLAIMVGCGGVSSTGTLAYISNSTGSGFTVYTVNSDGTLTTSSISPQSTPAAPRVLQFSANGKWAYFLDAAGDNIYAYTRSGNGTFGTFINNYSVGGTGASSMVISPNSAFIYVALPNTLGGSLAIFSIDPSTGILTQVGSSLQLIYPLTKLIMAPSGSALYALSPGAPVGKQTVLSWTLNSTSGQVQGEVTTSVGVNPIDMALSANGSYLYVFDHTATTTVANVANCSPPGLPSFLNCTPAGPSPNIYGFSVSGANLTTLGTFNENADLATGMFPSGPIAGATSNDSRYLFVANQGSANISVFAIATTGLAGGLKEVLGSLTTVNGIPASTASPFDCSAGCKSPSFITVASANNALYLIDTTPQANKILQFAINQSTGQLRPLNPASVGAENATSTPTWITIEKD